MPVPSTEKIPPPSAGKGWSWTRGASDWREWWRGLPRWRRVGPAIGVVAFWGVHAALGGFRADHVALGLAVLAFAYADPRAAPWFRPLLPAALMEREELPAEFAATLSLNYHVVLVRRPYIYLLRDNRELAPAR